MLLLLIKFWLQFLIPCNHSGVAGWGGFPPKFQSTLLWLDKQVFLKESNKKNQNMTPCATVVSSFIRLL